MRTTVILCMVVSLLVILVMAAPVFAQQQVVVTLNPMPGETATGTATLVAMDGQTQVTLQMSGLTPGVHANHIHVGSCDNIGDVVFPLTDLNADAQGNAQATTVLNVPLSTIQATQHLVAAHSGPLPAPTIACGNIPVVAGAVAVAPAAVAGGPSGSLLAGMAVTLGTLFASGGLLLRRRGA